MFLSTVSIILPTYNRARFLPAAFESIRIQSFADWELIVVDDGSQDDTCDVVQRLAPVMGGPVRYVRRENGGPALARNTGLDLAKGKYVAFLDSDDCWLPHHLKDTVAALEANPDVEWIFCAGQRVDYCNNRVLIEHTMYGNPEPPQYLKLRTRSSGRLRIFDDPDVLRCVLRSGGFAGLQTALIRREVFSRLRFQSVGFFEDRLAYMQAIALGIRMGFLDDVHVIVYSHDSNISFASNKALESRLTSMLSYVKAMENLAEELPLSRRECRALRAKRGEESFWNMGYFLVQVGRYRDALPWMIYGLRCCPSNIRFWKTYLATRVKALLA